MNSHTILEASGCLLAVSQSSYSDFCNSRMSSTQIINIALNNIIQLIIISSVTS